MSENRELENLKRERDRYRLALEQILTAPANANSDPDVMADSLEAIHGTASAALGRG